MTDDKAKPDLTAEAHKIVTEAVDAVEAFASAVVKLPADVAKLALDTLLATVDKTKSVVKDAVGEDTHETQ